MAKRISEDELNDRLAAARADYLKAMEAAAGDGARVSVAEKQLAWAEESARQAFNQRSGLYRFFDSIPLIGRPIAIILDHTEKGISEHGLVLGLARGLLIGLVLAVALVVVTEAVAFFFDVGRGWLRNRWGAGLESEQRTNAIAEADKQSREKLLHRGTALDADGIRYYVVDHTSAHIHDGGFVNFQMLMTFDPKVLTDAPQTLSHGAKISPFFHHFEASTAHAFLLNIPIPFSDKPGHSDVATITDPQTKAEYVVAAIDDTLVIIPLQDYKAARLPMHEAAATSPKAAPAPGPSPSAKPEPPAQAPISPVVSGPPATPAEQNRNLLNPVILSEEVPCVPVSSDQYDHALDSDPEVQSALRSLTKRFGEPDRPGAVGKLRRGVPYAPYLRSPTDPASEVTIEGFDGNSYILVTLKTMDSASHYQRVLMPKSEYESYLNSLKGDPTSPR